MIRGGHNFRDEKERKLARGGTYDEVGRICAAFIIGHFTFLVSRQHTELGCVHTRVNQLHENL